MTTVQQGRGHHRRAQALVRAQRRVQRFRPVRDWIGHAGGHVDVHGRHLPGRPGVRHRGGAHVLLPVTCEGGKWQIVQGLPIDGGRALMDATAEELAEEKAMAEELIAAM